MVITITALQTFHSLCIQQSFILIIAAGEMFFMPYFVKVKIKRTGRQQLLCIRDQLGKIPVGVQQLFPGLPYCIG